jgi:general secretion pathway protein F
MPVYHYIAINLAGKEQKGTIESDSEKQARQWLRDKSLLPIQVQATQQKKLSSEQKFKLPFFKLSPSLNSKELALVTRQLATLVAAGLPVDESLLAVAEQMDKPRIKGLILSVRSKVLEGHALAAALNEQNFSALFCATIAAGERSGHLDKVLLRLADYTEQQWQMRQKLRTALIYPGMIVLVAFGIVGFLLQYVVPKMIAVYGHLGQALPVLTRVLLAISALVQSAGLYVLLAIIAAIYLWRRALKKSFVLRKNSHYFLLRLPLIGHMLTTVNTARFARTLSILSSSGVPVLEAMHISAQLITLIPIREAVEEAVNSVREGTAIYMALKQTGYFSPMTIHMIASGEASGQVEAMLERTARFQEDEISRLIEVGLALFEPIVILVMGVIVLFIVLAVLLPIFQLNEFT